MAIDLITDDPKGTELGTRANRLLRFCDLPTQRAAAAASLQALWQSQTKRKDVAASTHASPEDALRAAVEAANPTDRILVFGSFFTVGGVLQGGLPRLQARHLGS